jgi:predicted nucleotidyltransferase
MDSRVNPVHSREPVRDNVVSTNYSKIATWLQIHFPDAVVSVRLFGSVARGDADEASDFDILIVTRRELGLEEKRRIHAALDSDFCRKTSISWYSTETIRRMYLDGHLFAWHLHLESTPLTGLATPDFLASLDAPGPYTECEADIAALIDIMSTIPAVLRESPKSSVYEAGVLFVCLRNIALSASWYSPAGLDFSRYSPLSVGRQLGIPLRIEGGRYYDLVRARLSSQRGIQFDDTDAMLVVETCCVSLEWAHEMQEFATQNNLWK